MTILAFQGTNFVVNRRSAFHGVSGTNKSLIQIRQYRHNERRRPVSAVLLPRLMMDIEANFDEPVAAGSFGDVFFGRIRSDGSPVVLKRSRPSATAKALFRREKEINSRLRSTETPRWPTYLGTFTKDSATFLVWRRAGTGRTLEHYLSCCGPTALGDALNTPAPAGSRMRVRLFRVVVCELLRAADEMHSRGIVHRDLKPENVLVVPGAIRPLQIIDFGGALDVRVPLWSRRTLHTLDPLYAAPETRATLFAPDRFDIYSIGLIALQVLLPSMSTAELRHFRNRLLQVRSLSQLRSEMLKGRTSCGATANIELQALFNESDAAATSAFNALSIMLTKSAADRCTARRALEMLKL